MGSCLTTCTKSIHCLSRLLPAPCTPYYTTASLFSCYSTPTTSICGELYDPARGPKPIVEYWRRLLAVRLASTPTLPGPIVCMGQWGHMMNEHVRATRVTKFGSRQPHPTHPACPHAQHHASLCYFARTRIPPPWIHNLNSYPTAQLIRDQHRAGRPSYRTRTVMARTAYNQTLLISSSDVDPPFRKSKVDARIILFSCT